jgi:hypothetical protein
LLVNSFVFISILFGFYISSILIFPIVIRSRNRLKLYGNYIGRR